MHLISTIQRIFRKEKLDTDGVMLAPVKSSEIEKHSDYAGYAAPLPPLLRRWPGRQRSQARSCRTPRRCSHQPWRRRRAAHTCVRCSWSWSTREARGGM